MKIIIRFCSTSSSPVTISKRAMRPSWLSFTRDSFAFFCLTADFLSWLRFDVMFDTPFDQIETAKKKWRVIGPAQDLSLSGNPDRGA
jgi:hypothetical protein